jgi:hypothetical protein
LHGSVAFNATAVPKVAVVGIETGTGGSDEDLPRGLSRASCIGLESPAQAWVCHVYAEWVHRRVALEVSDAEGGGGGKTCSARAE